MKRRFGTVPSFLFFGVALIFDGSAKGDIFEHGPRNLRQVAFTFDACSTKENGYEPKIIETLKATGTPATLFLGGRWMEAHRPLVRELMKSKLFELGSHSYTHPHMDKLPQASVDRQFMLSQKTFKALTGKAAKLWRPPFGDINDFVVESANKHGLRTVKWDLPSGDPDPKLSLEKIISATSENARNGSIIVMHMNGRGIHTAEALPEVIKKLKARGFTFVTVGKLIEESVEKSINKSKDAQVPAPPGAARK